MWRSRASALAWGARGRTQSANPLAPTIKESTAGFFSLTDWIAGFPCRRARIVPAKNYKAAVPLPPYLLFDIRAQ